MKKLLIVLFLFTAQVFATVSDGETVRQAFQPNGVATTYTFTFSCNSSDDVFVYAPLTSTGDPTAALTIDTDYTIAPTGGSYLNGGVVTITPALASTYTVKIVRRIKQSQETSSGAITPTSIVAALDKLTRAIQDAEDRKNRSVHIPDSDATSFNMEIPNSIDRASKFLGFDTLGNVTLFDSTASGSGGVIHSSFGTSFAITATASTARTLLELSTSDNVEFAAITGTTGTFSGLITANAGITLGSGDDLIGSATSDITFNTDKFTVAGATGNTLVGGTMDVLGNIDPTSYETTRGGFIDDDAMGVTATDTVVASAESIKAYVDNSVVGDSVTINDSDTNPLAITNTYQTQTSGFVSGYIADSAAVISGFVGGVQVVQTQGGASSADSFVYFFVPKGVIFQITAGSALTMTWTPLVGGGGAPIKQ